MSSLRSIYVDIDGTLTKDPDKPWGEPELTRIAKVAKLISDGHQVVLWSANGSRYARAFATLHGLTEATALAKPQICVDDNPTIRPAGSMPIVDPKIFFGD